MAQKYLTDCKSFYSCLYCRAHLANHDELISRSFQGNRSRAYLFNSVINITTGAPVQRELNTGSHAVADIFCSNCGTTVGWKYEKAYVDSQKYKEGKFIIELAHVVRENRHLELDKRDMFLALHLGLQAQLQDRLKPTIGQLHQGSVSPLSNSAESRWSYGTGSASSQGGDAVARYSEPISLYECEEHEDDDEQEVLMFPFHDDLYGERANYSNLSISRLSYTRRNRRSFHLDSTPYDWKYSTRPSESLNLGPNCSPSVEQQSSASSGSLPAVKPAREQRAEKSDQQPKSSSKSATTSNATRRSKSSMVVAKRQGHHLEESSSDEDDERQRRNHDENEILFKLDPCDSSTLSDNQNCDQSPANKRTRLEPSPSLSSTWNCQSGQSGLVEAPANHDESEMVGQLRASGSSAASSSHVESDLTAPGCSNVDDEEFYDCCAGEHQVLS